MTKNEKSEMLKKKKDAQLICDTLQGENIFYGDKIMKLNCGLYTANNNLVLTLFDPEDGPFANITVNIKDLPADHFCVDINNFPEAETILTENKLAEPTEVSFRSGFCIYPVYKLTMDKFFN